MECNKSVLNDFPRTSNNAEAWHRAINSAVYFKTLNIALFIEKLLIDEKVQNMSIKQSININFEYSRMDHEKNTNKKSFYKI